ncbi:hypothetical protein BDY21DRAFT_393171 [Lineolata rhizophorae]|uniref:Alpha/Beta hydrolase protein n=1 Tax=Lineolata rhizophorae TaxID=578093 RepID=A0A6A6P0A9_9PEZI|nr:hypothetical protein BDY21DRAFT_393171 [Lineolata rhizophorae]
MADAPPPAAPRHASLQQASTPYPKHAYPRPLTIPPRSGTHTHTLILLAPRLATSDAFGIPFLTRASTSARLLLPRLFPRLKLVFAGARKRRASRLGGGGGGGGGAWVNQWFDVGEAGEGEAEAEAEEGMFEGLREAVRAGDMQEEGEAAAEGRQGPPEDGLAGFVGLSAWMPFAGLIAESCFPQGIGEGGAGGDGNESATRGGERNKHTDDTAAGGSADESPSGRRELSASPQTQFHAQTRAQAIPPSHHAFHFARDITCLDPVDLPANATPPFVRTPVFFGHGTDDAVVPVWYGQQARDVLTRLGCDVSWTAYEGFGQGYKVPDEIDDLADFLEKVGVYRAT